MNNVLSSQITDTKHLTTHGNEAILHGNKVATENCIIDAGKVR